MYRKDLTGLMHNNIVLAIEKNSKCLSNERSTKKKLAFNVIAGSGSAINVLMV